MRVKQGQVEPAKRRVLVLVGLVALLIGFASSATAGVIVTGKQIKDGTIASRDLRDASLRGADVKDESLTGADFVVPPVGPPGPKGDPGPQGPSGRAGLFYKIEPRIIAKNDTETWGALCGSGSQVISGGGSADTQGLAYLTESAPLEGRTGWWVGIRNTTTSSVTGYAWALCVSATG
jgi:hypothetical protein